MWGAEVFVSGGCRGDNIHISILFGVLETQAEPGRSVIRERDNLLIRICQIKARSESSANEN